MEINYVMIGVTLIFILLDVCSGLVAAIANKNVDSTVMRNGLFHKLAFVFSIALGALIEWGSLYIDLGLDLPIMEAICLYVCLTEIASILENICKLNPALENNKFMSLFTRRNDG